MCWFKFSEGYSFFENKNLKLMEIKIDQKKQVEAIVKFNKPLSCRTISVLVGDAVVECNRILSRERKKIPFLKRIFTSSDVYVFNSDMRHYFSFDGKHPMIRAGKYLLDPESYPEVKYETRYLLSIVGLRNAHLYFNVIPGVARERQFGTEISEKDEVFCITIKANLKSNLRWKQEQAKFLELLVPIIEKMNQEMKWGHRIGDLFFENI